MGTLVAVQKRNMTPELEAVENAIDTEHLKNRLSRLTFAEAAWYLLAFCEEMQFKRLQIDGVSGRQNMACHVDELVNGMKTPLRWLSQACEPGEKIPRRFCDKSYQSSWDLSKLAYEYDSFETAYIYASAGAIALQLQGDTIVSDDLFRKDARYEAYDRLCIDELPTLEEDSIAEFFRNVAQTVTDSNQRFRYRLNPRIVSLGLDAMSPILSQYWLPDSWQMPRYSFGEFRCVLNSLRVMAMIHHLARITAASNGCVHLGYLDSVLIMDDDELPKRLQRYTGLDAKVINEIVHDLTFGECGIRNPDPAIQPLIRLSPDRFAISPSLFLGVDVERNFTVLLNRLPEEKKVYSQLSNHREKISRRRIIKLLQPLEFRFWYGQLPGRDDLPDLDLAIIDDVQRTCLLLEIKSFIGPAEPREILEKSEEIQRGVAQIKSLQNAFRLEPQLFTSSLKIDVNYDVSFAVASETFIGTHNVQDKSVPVVRVHHLVRRLLTEKSLAIVSTWLRNREYLPTLGEHFEVKDIVAQVGAWKLQWYGIKPLITDEYL